MISSEPRYHIARQRHLGEALDDLVRVGWLHTWRWDYAGSTAYYWIEPTADAQPVKHETRAAEILVQEVCSRHSVTWHPARHPGGQPAREGAVELNRVSGYYAAFNRAAPK